MEQSQTKLPFSDIDRLKKANYRSFERYHLFYPVDDEAKTVDYIFQLRGEDGEGRRQAVGDIVLINKSDVSVRCEVAYIADRYRFKEDPDTLLCLTHYFLKVSTEAPYQDYAFKFD